MSTLDDLMDLDHYYQEQEDEPSGSVSYIGLKELPVSPSDEIVCSECTQPIAASFLRYDRSVKHTQLLCLMNGFRRKQTSDYNQHCARVIHSLSGVKDTLLKGLAKVKASPCPNLTRSSDRRVMVVDGGLVGDLGEIASLYHIPWRHQMAWKEAIKPAEDALAFFGQSLVERSPIKNLCTVLVQKSTSSGQGSKQLRRRKPFALTSETAPFTLTDEELSRAIQVLGLEDAIETIDEAIETVDETKLCNIGSSYLVLSSIFGLAVEAMQVAGAETGWYWFVGDLIKCCQAFKYHHRAMALKYGFTEIASTAGQMVLEGFCRKVRWMTKRPLGGMGSSEEYRYVLEQLEQAFSEEVSEQRVGGHGPVHEWMLKRMEKEMTALLQEAKREDDGAECSVM